jgi:ribosomal protein S27E
MAKEKLSHSRFYLVKCECGNEQYIFSNISTKVNCFKCNKPLALPTGGKSKILGSVRKVI